MPPVRSVWPGPKARAAAALVVVLLLGGCTFRTAAATDIPRPAASTIAVIGDSISADLATDLRRRDFDGPAGVTWSITAQTGAGWGEGLNAQGNWPLEVVQGNWAAAQVDTAANAHPSAVVIELGTNDALRAAFAFVANSSTDLAARLTGTRNNISSVVRDASSLSKCVVLVTPSYYPPTTFGAEVHYTQQAWGIRSQLLQQVSMRHGRTVAIADWAALSSPHHLQSGAPGTWFVGDGLHPNISGERALAALIVQTVNGCS